MSYEQALHSQRMSGLQLGSGLGLVLGSGLRIISGLFALDVALVLVLGSCHVRCVVIILLCGPIRVRARGG